MSLRPRRRPAPSRLRRDRFDDRLNARARWLRLRQRLDPLLLLLWLMLLLGGAMVLSLAVDRLGKADLLEPPVVAPVADERIYRNVQPGKGLTPWSGDLLAAVHHAPEDALFLSREGGVVHRYDLSTGLWSDERPFAGFDDRLSGDLVQLRSGCGQGEPSAGADGCGARGALWALGRDGALLRRQGGRWQALIDDTRFVGDDGQPVEHEALSAAALSADRRWLLLAAGSKGVGLYDLRSRGWVSLSARLREPLGELSITELRWWRDRFWVATDRGLAWLDPVALEAARGHLGMDAPIIALTVTRGQDPRLLVLEQRRCGNDPALDCQRLLRLRSPDGPATVLIDEVNRFPALDLARTHHAQRIGRDLVLAGDAGVHAFNLQTHGWRRLVEPAITAVRERPGGLAVGWRGAAALIGVGVDGGAAVTRSWDLKLPRQSVAQLIDGRAGELLALTDRGLVLGLHDRFDEPRLVFPAQQPALDPRDYRLGFAADPLLLLLPSVRDSSPALLHNYRRRRYLDIPRGELPEWLLPGDDPVPGWDRVVSGQAIYGVVCDLGSGTLGVVDLAKLAAGESAAVTLPGAVATPLKRLAAWPGERAGLVDREGALWLASADGLERLSTPRAPFESYQLKDIWATPSALLGIADGHLYRYDHARRAWSEPLIRAIGAQRLAGIALDGDRAWLRTEGGLLADGRTREILIGSPESIGIADEDLSDVLGAGADLFLAGGGRVARYQTRQRRVDARWRSGEGPVALIGSVDRVPLTLSAGELRLGGRVLKGPPGPVRSASLGERGRIWSVREGRQGRFLMAHERAAHGYRCFFLQPRLPSGRRIIDALSLAQGWTAVLSDAGLHFYNEQARSWVRGLDLPMGDESRLFVVGSDLFLVDRSRQRVRFLALPLSALQRPHSCDLGLELESAGVTLEPTEVRDISVDPAAVSEVREPLIIARDGALQRWRDGSLSELLPSDRGAPRLSRLRRIHALNDRLYFTAEDAVWSYAPASHAWRGYVLDVPGGPHVFDRVSLAAGREGIRVTASAAGRTWHGSLRSDRPGIDLDELPSVRASPVDMDPSRLLDLSRGLNDDWVFLSPGRMHRFDPVTRSWALREMDAKDPSMRLASLLGKEALVTDRAWWLPNGRNGRLVPIARPEGAVQSAFGLDFDGAIRVFNRFSDGRVQACGPLPAHGCELLLPSAPRLDEGEVASAWAFGSDGARRYLVVGPAPERRLRLFVPTEAKELPLGGALQSLAAAPTSVWSRNNALLLLEEGGRALSVDTGGTTRILAEGVTRVERIGASVWLWNGALPQRWLGDRLESLADAMGLGDTEGLVGAEINDQLLIAWGGDGRIYLRPNSALAGPAWQGPGFADIDDPSRIRHLFFRDRGERSWWLFLDDELRLYHTACADDEEGAGDELGGPRHCLRLIARAAYPPELGGSGSPRVIAAELSSDRGASFETSDGLRLRASSLGQGLSLVPLAPARQGSTRARSHAGSLADSRDELIAMLEPMPDGGQALLPVTALVLEGDDLGGRAGPALDGTGDEPRFMRSLVARRGLGLDLELSRHAQSAPRLRGGLDTGWLRWVRGARELVVDGKRLTPDQLIVDGQLIFTAEGPLGVTSDQRVQLANRHGIFTFADTSLSLAAGVSYRPLDPAARGRAPLSLAHSRVLLVGGGSLDLDGGDWQPDWTPPEVRRDGLRFVEQARGIGIEALMRIADGSHKRWRDVASPEGGFDWDKRLALVRRAGAPLLQSRAGLHPPAKLSGFDADPAADALARRPGARLLQDGPALVLLDGGAAGPWLEWSATGWRGSERRPHADGPLLDGPRRRWQRRGGEVQVDWPAAAADLNLGFDNGGFSDDLLQGASLHRGRLLVMTGATLELHAGADSLAAKPDMAPPRSLDAMFEVRLSPSEPASLFARDPRGTLLRWHEADARFAALDPADQHPFDDDRLLFDHDRLRFEREGGTGRIRMTLRFDGSGGERWQPFRFVDGHLPFDLVTGMAGLGGKLFVGTKAGLLIHADPDRLGLGEITSLLAVGPPADAAGLPLPVQRLGNPADAPERVRAASASGCLDMDAQGRASDCARAIGATEMRRGESAFWRWGEGPDGLPQGRYLDHQGQPLGLTAGLDLDAVLPHDALVDIAHCQGRTLVLWGGGRALSLFEDDRASLTLPFRSFRRPAASAPIERLICLARPPQDGLSLAAGAYAEIGDGGVEFLGSPPTAAGRRLGAAEAASVRQRRAGGDVLLEHRRLRLKRSEAGAFNFERRADDGAWLPIGWAGSVPEIDRIGRIAAAAGHIWAATPHGLVPFGRDASGDLTLDPDRPIAVAEPRVAGADGSSRYCQPTDLDSPERNRLRARCRGDSALVFAGDLAQQRDHDLFVPLESDPFVGRELIGGGAEAFWSWRLVDRRGSSKGRLQAHLGDEPLALDNGRFPFDGLVSVIGAREQGLELVSETGGWFRSQGDDLAVSGLQRPRGLEVIASGSLKPQAVQRMAWAFRERTEQLCVEAEGAALSFSVQGDGVGKQARCRDWLGDDGLWLYLRDGDRLAMLARDSSGRSGERRLSRGRFTDDVARGFPLLPGAAAGPSLLIPTDAGLRESDEQGARLGMRFVPGGPVDALHEAGDGSLWCARGGERLSVGPLEQGCAMDTGIGGPLRVLGLAAGPEQTLRLDWQRGGRRGWNLFDPASSVLYQATTRSMSLADWPYFRARRRRWGDPSPLISIARLDGRLTLVHQDRAFALPGAGSAGFSTLLFADRRAFLLHPDRLDAVQIGPWLRGVLEGKW